MKDHSYWKNYVYETDAQEIERHLKRTSIKSRRVSLSLKYFVKSNEAPNILWVVGTGCYSLYLAELGYLMHLEGYNTFGLDFQGHGDSEGPRGDFTVTELVQNCTDAVSHIATNFNDRIGVVGISLGGFVTFYLGLSHGTIKSISCLNPAILTETRFRNEVTKARKIPPVAGILSRLFPRMTIPTERCVDFQGLAETEREVKHVETYMKDPDVIKRYTLRALISQVSTPPPNPIGELRANTMFLVPTRDRLMSVSYVRDLYDRLPSIKKRFVEVGGGHYWVSSHPRDAAEVICDWFNETL